MRALCFAIAIAGAGCAVDIDDPAPEVDESGDHLGEAEITRAAGWCAAGWHEHYVTWPEVGRRRSTCGPVVSTIGAGRHVCMLSTSPIVCQGQGYIQAYLMETEGPSDWLWVRMEAFNGH